MGKSLQNQICAHIVAVMQQRGFDVPCIAVPSAMPMTDDMQAIAAAYYGGADDLRRLRRLARKRQAPKSWVDERQILPVYVGADRTAPRWPVPDVSGESVPDLRYSDLWVAACNGPYKLLDKGMLCVLIERAERKDGWRVPRTRAELADQAVCKPDTITESLDRLAALGVLTCIRSRGLGWDLVLHPARIIALDVRNAPTLNDRDENEVPTGSPAPEMGCAPNGVHPDQGAPEMGCTPNPISGAHRTRNRVHLQVRNAGARSPSSLPSPLPEQQQPGAPAHVAQVVPETAAPDPAEDGKRATVSGPSLADVLEAHRASQGTGRGGALMLPPKVIAALRALVTEHGAQAVIDAIDEAARQGGNKPPAYLEATLVRWAKEGRAAKRPAAGARAREDAPRPEHRIVTAPDRRPVGSDIAAAAINAMGDLFRD